MVSRCALHESNNSKVHALATVLNGFLSWIASYLFPGRELLR